MTESIPTRPRRRRPSVVLRDAIIVSALSAAVALGANAVRDDGIPVIADKEYQILVPCPEPVGDVEEMAATDPLLLDDTTHVVDAREQEAYDEWHVPGARSAPFDFLDSTPKATVEEIASSGKHRIAVYGDGDDPDSGYELGRELSGLGLKNIFFVKGGAPAVRSALTATQDTDSGGGAK